MEYLQLQTVRAGGYQFDSYFGHVALKGKQISQEVYNVGKTIINHLPNNNKCDINHS